MNTPSELDLYWRRMAREDWEGAGEWLRYLAEFTPEKDILAYHVCAVAMEELCARQCRVVYTVYLPGWKLQPVKEEEKWPEESLMDIFGSDVTGFIITYCPFCGEHLPDLGEDTLLDPWHGHSPITMSMVAREMNRTLGEECEDG